MKRLLRFPIFLLFAVVALGATNTVTVSGVYDFTVNNACSATVTTGCVKQFNVYDLTSGTAVKVGSIIAPAGANTATASVSGSFTVPAFIAGARTFGFSAQMADGTESDPKALGVTSIQTVRPGAPINLTLTVT